MSTVPNDCIYLYNSVLFDPNATETLHLSVKPMYDAAGRTVVYNVYSITLKSIIAQQNQPATSDDFITTLRTKLTKPGGELIYENQGLGRISVNTSLAGRPARDVVWGPKPQLLTLKPLGQLACEVVWTVEVAIPECDPGVTKYQFALMEFNFQLSFDIDQSGYTRRTYSGFLRIPQSRATVNTRTLTDHADKYRERIYPPLLPGFRRIPGRFTLSADKCRLDFEVVDQEIGPNYPPDGVVEVSADHVLATSEAASIRWTGTISATYEMARGTPRSVAFERFMELVADRVGQGKLTLTTLNGKPQQATPIPRAMSIREPEIHGRKGASFTYTYIMACSLVDILAASGLWRPVPNTDGTRWAQSMALSAANVRGNARLAFDLSGESIIDLCTGNGPRTLKGGLPPQQTRTLRANFPRPDFVSSWIIYACRLRLEPEDGIHVLKTLPLPGFQLKTGGPVWQGGGYSLSTNPSASSKGRASITSTIGEGDPFAGGGKIDSNITPTADNSGFGPVQVASLQSNTGGGNEPGEVVIQERTGPTWYAFLEGYAVRAGWPAVVPFLESVGGVTAVRACRKGEGVAMWQMDDWFGVPIYAAEWNIRYALDGRPDGAVPIPGIPLRP